MTGKAVVVEDLGAWLGDDSVAGVALRNGEIDSLTIAGHTFVREHEASVYRALVEAMSEGAAVLSPDGLVLYANSCLATMVGRPLAELMGAPLAACLSEESRGSVEALLNHTTHERTTLEAALISATEPTPVLLSAAPLKVGPRDTVVVVVTDLSERRRAEAQRLGAIERMAGGLAHDFNNLLTIILSSTDALAAAPAVQADAEALVDVRAILQAAERAREATRNLLAISRRQALHLEPIEVARLVNDQRPMLRRLLPAGVSLQVDLEKHHWWAVADAAQLEQVLFNLVTNARDALDGSGTVTVAVADVHLNESQGAAHKVPPGDYVELSVTDTGRGMDAVTLARACEPFFTTKQMGHGTGLGLALVLGVAQQCGGGVRLTSAPNVGTSVRVVLRKAAAGPASAAVAPQLSPEATPVGLEQVLVVDDEPAVRRSLVRLLRMGGYGVIEASDGEEALAVIERAPPELVITDLAMPRLNGHQLIDQLLTRFPQVPVLAISGRPVSEQELAVPFLNKPYRTTELLELIRQLLDRRRAPRAMNDEA